MAPLLLLSQDTGRRAIPRRTPLVRIVLPVQIVAEHGYLPGEHVWWVERHGQAYYLRAKLQVSEVTVEQEPDGDVHRVVWQLDSTTSERVTWPGTRSGNGGDVTGLLGELVQTRPRYPSIVPVSVNIDVEIESRRLQIATSAWRFEDAASALQRLFHRESGHIPQRTPAHLAFGDAWSYVHMYFAREELFRIEGYDAYDVAAAVLAGCTTLPQKNSLVQKTACAAPAVEDTLFWEIDEENIGYTEPSPVQSADARIPLEKIAEKTKHHQAILKALALQIRAMSMRPTYNRHIDLRVELEDMQVFFEIKTIESGNLLEQVRCAVGQLLEYRFRYRRRYDDKAIRLVIVIEDNVSTAQMKFIQDFLADVGITLVLWRGQSRGWEGLTEALS